MRLRVLAVGQKMPAWIDQGVDEYARRLPKGVTVEWLSIAPAKRGTESIERYQQIEAESIRAKLTAEDYLVALHARGREITTETISERLTQWQMGANRVCIVIGGPDGLHPSLLDTAQEQWSFGRITLPHPLVRVILSEQLYRAWSIQAGHPYHRGN
jgi:23S rRNA (pseudouridine1915-N3)-methyltransferase